MSKAGQNPSPPRSSLAIRIGAILVPLAATGVLAWLVFLRDSGPRPFDIRQGTPQEVFESARRMVVEGRAELLTELVYADSDELRTLYRQLGSVLGSLQSAAMAAADRFPAEIAAVRAEALKAAQEGRSASLIEGVLTGRRQSGGRGSSQQGGRLAKSDDPFADVIIALLSDPYGWIERNSDKLGTATISDTMVAVTWDSRPILPPFGVIMEQREDDKWYFMLPTQQPGVKEFLGQDPEQLQMLGYMLMSARNALADLATDMRGGKITTLDQASTKLGEYAFPTVALGMAAYGKYMQEKRQERRAAPGG